MSPLGGAGAGGPGRVRALARRLPGRQVSEDPMAPVAWVLPGVAGARVRGPAALASAAPAPHGSRRARARARRQGAGPTAAARAPRSPRPPGCRRCADAAPGAGRGSFGIACGAVRTGEGNAERDRRRPTIALSPITCASAMKLATYKDGSRDGQLVVVSRDLATAHYRDRHRDPPAAGARRLELPRRRSSKTCTPRSTSGKARHAFAFDPAQCMAPLPRAYQWADGSAYHQPRRAGAQGAQRRGAGQLLRPTR